MRGWIRTSCTTVFSRCRHISTVAFVGISGIWTSSGGENILAVLGWFTGWAGQGSGLESAVRGNMMNEELFSFQGPGSGRWWDSF
ncbi:hypothetical protein AVEN_153184-1 [Araneus ventricosus]|uniref:Uncharacterized protein n=1 Tax=Araneus ventricosus TaxID=182803 RepID=A0A4Y2FHM6_ARAVE|nr:hypothetical protein AVEN_153184-1 [Araneus ventricosus]